MKARLKRKDHLSVDVVSYEKKTGRWVYKNNVDKDLPVRMVVDVDSYKKLPTKVQRRDGARNLRTHTEDSVADTGATVLCGGKHLLDGLGIKKTDLIPSSISLEAANGEAIFIMGAVPVQVTMLKNGITMGEPQLEFLHISKQLEQVLLSRDLLKNFSSISPEFPYPPNIKPTYATLFTGQDMGDTNNNEKIAPCRCPVRTIDPQLPELPCEPTEENIPIMKAYLLQYFESSTFNECEHQPLPLINGPDFEIKVREGAVPIVVRVPATIPIYWREKVKKQLDRDVEMGVLEWVPMNTPETWCSRMVVTAKHNGEPRRTIDLQGLNDASVRQNHHTEPPI